MKRNRFWLGMGVVCFVDCIVDGWARWSWREEGGRVGGWRGSLGWLGLGGEGGMNGIARVEGESECW